ncbi:MAG: DEAD/DEAH box helicase [Gallionellaceae bacterium]|nr:DEAD/DEAH box helicase [Gallionellaceae bacterium]
MKLRPYQSHAIAQARANFADGIRRQIVYSPTGSGKTEIAIALIRSAIAKGKRVAFVANRIGLVDQAERRLSKAGLVVGVIQGENTRHLDAPVLVCSIQTVARRGLPDVDVIVVDEAHGVAGSADYRKVMFAHSALPVIGLTATPFAKGLGKSYTELGGMPLFERIVKAATIRELIELGFLVDCDIYAPSDPDLSGVGTVRNAFGEADYNEKDLAAAVDKPALVGDIVTHWRRLGRDLPTVVFASSIAHSKHIAEQFNAAGIRAEHIDFRTTEEERRDILARVTSGQTRIISNVAILSEGWDFPACGVMVLARPTKSLTRWIQMAGRVLRPYPGKERAIVLDHSGSSAHLGYPTEDLPLDLDDGTPKKASASADKEEPKPKKCPSCSYMKPAKVHACPACGFAPERQSDVQTVDGDLKPLARKRADKIDKQDAYSQLLQIRKEHRYSAGWVSHQYRELFGVWPRGLAEIPRPPSQEMRNWIRSRQIRYAKQQGGSHDQRP